MALHHPLNPSPPPLQTWAQQRDPQTRLSLLVQWAKQQPPFPPSLRQENHLIPGCLARLWWIQDYQEGLCRFFTDSDSALVKGLALVLASHFHGRSPRDIVMDPTDPLKLAQLDHHLTAHRRDGLIKVRDSVRLFAESCLERWGDGPVGGRDFR